MIFDIPELDEMVCSQLDLASLVKCAVVNKQWNRIATPYVWRTIPRTRSQNQWRKLHRFILEGYFQQKYREKKEEQQQQLQSSGGRPQKQRTTRYVRDIWRNLDEEMTITKYGRFIQEVEDWYELWKGLTNVGTVYVGRLKPKDFEPPSDLEIFQHFLQQCPRTLRSFQFQLRFCQLIGPPEKSRLEDVLRFLMNIVPSVQNLSIGYMIQFVHFGESCPLLLLKHILAATNVNNLDSLSIMITADPVHTSIAAEFAALENNPNPEILARPRHLTLFHLDDNSDPAITSWSWLWQTCSRLTSLETHGLEGHVLEDLSLGIQECMPCLETLRLNGPFYPGSSTKRIDTVIAGILSANTKGWRVVGIELWDDIGSEVVSALLESSYSTLQNLVLGGLSKTCDVVRLLRSLPQLRKLDIQRGSYKLRSFKAIDANVFLDLDPNTGTLIPWPCMNTLESLVINFSISGPWLQQVDQDSFAQALTVQLQLLERIGKFPNLRVLRLCFLPRDDYLKSYSYNPTKMNLTIDTGLTKLAGLRKLEEIDLWNMADSFA
ncbi:hypothetical protein BG004_000938, partial [Podila humilis]